MQESDSIFDYEIYKRFNLDLAHLSREELITHFTQHGRSERRIYAATTSTADYISMKWLRGAGLEIGAGRYPTRLFGNAKCEYGDTEGGEIFGTKNIRYQMSIDKSFPQSFHGKYSFLVVSHVLEHADGIIKSICNMLSLLKNGGILYIVVPDRTFLEDAKWLPEYDFKHHIDEFTNPGIYNDEHDKLAIEYMKKTPYLFHPSGDSQFDPNSLEASGSQVEAGKLLQILQGNDSKQFRFMLHKHTYDFNGWNKLFTEIQKLDFIKFKIEEIRYGMERMDFHIVLSRGL